MSNLLFQYNEDGDENKGLDFYKDGTICFVTQDNDWNLCADAVAMDKDQTRKLYIAMRRYYERIANGSNRGLEESSTS